MKNDKFNYIWSFKDYPEKNNINVMSTFACGGGSTMGYKLCGMNVIAASDIDSEMKMVYVENHHPKYFYHDDIRELNKRNDLPEELFNLDILDGSPPCSVFSMAGKRESDWGKEKKFREGQALQTLDDLFFHFIQLGEKLKPKVIIAENVKGLISGMAKGYVLEIFTQLNKIGYDTQLFLLNSATMGVPQKRQRVFFIARRKDLNWPPLKLEFNEPQIPFREVSNEDNKETKATELFKKYWFEAKPGGSVGKYKTVKKLRWGGPANTQLANTRNWHPKYIRPIDDIEITKVGSFPQDYNYCGIDPAYLIGMSVPPVMVAQIAKQIKLQWFDNIKA